MQSQNKSLKSIRTLFLLAMTGLVLVLSLPLLYSGGRLLENITQRLGSELLTEKLNALLNPVSRRYETLRRVGLEDSQIHLDEIRAEALNEFSQFHYMDSGVIFVVDKGGSIVLSKNYKNTEDPYFKDFFSRLQQGGEHGVLTYTAGGKKRLAAFLYYEPWQSYVGLTVRQDELFAARNLFYTINLLVLAVVFCIAAVFTFGLQQLIILPIIRLTRYATRISEGDFSATLSGRFILELALLKEDIRIMVVSLREKMEETTRQLSVIQQRDEELSRTVNELQESEERYRTIFNSPTDAIFVHDALSGEILDVNRAMIEMYGYSYSSSLKLTVQDISANDSLHNQEVAAKKIAASIEQGPQRFEWLAKRKNGELFWVEVALRHIRLRDRGYVIAVVRDVDARKKAEEALANEKERLAVTLQSIGDGVIATDTEGRVVILNGIAGRLTGFTEEEARGRPLPEIFHIVNEKTGALCTNPAEKVLATGLAVELENHTVLIARDGTLCPIADSGAPIRDQDNNIIGVVLVFRDMTEKMRTDQELIKIKKLESVGVLAAGIAHDFNNLLTAILGNIDLAELVLDRREEASRLLDEARKAALRARGLTQQLLTFARGGEPVRQVASIESVIRDSSEFILRGSNVICEYDIPPDLWLVEVDQGQVSQVIQNIILNARQAMADGGKIHVVCRNLANVSDSLKRLSGNVVSITISDTGPGIPAAVLERIFDPYYTTKDDGSGLGLSICHSIIAKHDGYIEASSRVGEGTTFNVLLPACKDTALEEHPLRKIADSGRALRILVMDDEDMVRDISRLMLEQLGHTVHLVKDGALAIAEYRNAMAAGSRFDLVIMDLTIPGGMGGKDAVGELLRLDPAAKVIVSSGYADNSVMADWQSHGFAGRLPKPFLMEDLREAIRQIIGQ